jgi:hypothetical protein
MTNLELADLVVHHTQYDPTIFEPWQEILDGSLTPLLPTVLGHLFLESTDRSVWFLDTWSGQLQQVAPDYQAFRSHIGTDEEFQDVLLTPNFIVALREAGMHLEAGQCYTPVVSPGLGGSLTPANFMVASLRVHLTTTAGEYCAIHGGSVGAV